MEHFIIQCTVITMWCANVAGVIIVRFSQSAYGVGENAGPVQPMLVLSHASPTDITIQVTNTDGSATGE